jgi:hypothetical protein
MMDYLLWFETKAMDEQGKEAEIYSGLAKELKNNKMVETDRGKNKIRTGDRQKKRR